MFCFSAACHPKGTLQGHLTGGCLGHALWYSLENALGSRFEACFLKIRATLAYFLCVWHLILGPFRLGPCWPGDVVSTADVCAKTTKMLW